MDGAADRERVAVRAPDHAQPGGAAEQSDERLSPQRAEREAVALPAATGRDQREDDPHADDPTEDPARPLAERADARPDRAAPQHLEVRVERSDRDALRIPEDHSTPHQETADRHDDHRPSP